MENNMTVKFAAPNIGAKEEEACLRVLRSGWLTTGTETLAFEDEFASYLNRGGTQVSCIAVSSATAGLHLALRTYKVGTGTLVLMPSYNFASGAEVTRYLGAEPVFIDVKPGTFHMDPEALEYTLARLSRKKPPYCAGGGGPRGKPLVIMPVHFGGLSCNMQAIRQIAKEYELKIVEDAAHAFPSLTHDGFLGTLGNAGVFSFYATKTITTGEGGMIAVKKQGTDSKMRTLRLHGIDRPVWNRYNDLRAPWRYEIRDVGYKYNMPDILAALGRVQLARCDSFLAERKAIAARYDAAFANDERFVVPPTGVGDARQLYPLRLAPGYSRDGFVRYMQNAGIGVSVHFIPLHTMPYYKHRYSMQPSQFPNTMAAFKQEISLPIWAGMTDDQVEYVIKTVLQMNIPPSTAST